MRKSGLFRIRNFAIASLAVIAPIFVSSAALAGTYGSGTYSQGVYQYQTSTANPSQTASDNPAATPGTNDSSGIPLSPSLGGTASPTDISGSSGWSTWVYGGLIALAAIWLVSLAIVRRNRRHTSPVPPTFIPPSY